MTSPTEASPLGSSFLPNHTLTAAMDGVSMASYSTSYSHNGTGVFCIRDPEPGPKMQQTKPAKPMKVSGEGPGPKKRKPPPTSESGADRKGGNSYNLPHISNGAVALSARAKPRPGQSEDRYGGAEFTGVHGGVSSHGSLTYGFSDDRKRKGPGPSADCDKPSKTSKSAGLDAIFRKSSLVSSVADTPHSAPSKQVTIFISYVFVFTDQ